MNMLAVDIREAADRLVLSAQHTRGHLLGFSGPAADRVRSYLADMQRQAEAEAGELNDLAGWLMNKSDSVRADLRDWHQEVEDSLPPH
jgi:hypothetical protein